MSQFHIEIFEDRDVPEKFRDDLEALFACTYGDGEGAVEFEPEPYTTILALDGDGMLLGHLAAYVRDVDFETCSMPLGMIGDVATFPRVQRRGIAKLMVEGAHAFFRSLDVKHSILFAYEPDVYRSSGYKMMANDVHFLDEDGAWKTFVYRGSMFCELSDQPWPKGLIHLNGRAV